MELPSTSPSGRNPASRTSRNSFTDRSEVNRVVRWPGRISASRRSAGGVLGEALPGVGTDVLDQFGVAGHLGVLPAARLGLGGPVVVPDGDGDAVGDRDGYPAGVQQLGDVGAGEIGDEGPRRVDG